MWSEKPCEVGAKERMVIKRGKMLGKKAKVFYAKTIGRKVFRMSQKLINSPHCRFKGMK